ncbi:ester cyclase [Pararhodobacter aggregans]|uniref:ester cyclase n=1 Tax=Pararhodobacter aggregans TaxID=404875 RepID=UPI003A8E7849
MNPRDGAVLPRFVARDVTRYGVQIGLAGYRARPKGDAQAIPDLAFSAAHLACDPPLIAARLVFDGPPVGQLFGPPVNGRKVRFTENVFHEYRYGRIAHVWSVIDNAALEAQLWARRAAAWDGLARRLTQAAKPLIFLAPPGVPRVGQAVDRAKRKAP